MGAVTPGPVSQGEAETLSGFAAATKANAVELARRQRPSERMFPVMITDFDRASGAHSWYRQAYTATGSRVAHPSGQSGGPARDPLYGIGGGSNAITTIPCEAFARFATTTASLGSIYEVQTFCACAGASGSGGDTTDGWWCLGLSDCPSGVFVPRNKFATIVVVSGTCACLPTDPIPLASWPGTFCSGNYVFYPLDWIPDETCTPFTGVFITVNATSGLASHTCSPYSSTLRYTLTGGPCAGAVIDVIVTG